MPPASLLPWVPARPYAGIGTASIPSGKLSASALMSYSTQCVNVPPGASGSSMTSANAFVSAGGPLHDSGGETFSPSQVKRAGIASSLPNASLVTENTVASLPTGDGVVAAAGVLAGALSPPPQAARSVSHTPSANSSDAF